MKENDLVPRAVAFAHRKHKDQKDRQGLPYILHPLTVMVYVVNHEKYLALTDREKTDICCIAILHDTVEDTDATPDDIQALLGRQSITDGVTAMTHDEKEPLESYWARAKANPLARIVKLCDLRHNSDPARLDGNPVDRKRREDKYRRALEFLKF